MKINIIQEKKLIFIITSVIITFITILILFSNLDKDTKLVCLLLFIVSYIIIIFCFLVSFQWYILDEEKVIVRNIFKTVNEVYYKDVIQAYIRKIPVFTKDNGMLCILFQDGRKERGIFNGYNIDNHRKYVVRIPYSLEVACYLKKRNVRIFPNIKDIYN